MKRKIRKLQRKAHKMPTLHRVIAVFTIILAVFFIAVTITFAFAPPFKAKVEYAHAKKADLAYYVRGKGEPLILLPSFGMTMQHWDPKVIEELSKDYEVIVFDYRGVGASSGEVKGISQDQMTDDVITLMDQLELDKAHIVGWSLGSFVAQNVAEKRPDRVDNLVLIATAPGGDEAVSAPKVIRDKVEKNMDGSWEKVFAPMMFVDHNKTKEYLERVKKAQETNEIPNEHGENLDAKVAFQLAFADEGREKARYENLSKIQAQTLIIAGDRDLFTPLQNARKVEQRIPHAELLVMHDAGHAVIFEDPEEVSNEIGTFLKKK